MQSGFEVENSGSETSILEPLKIGFFCWILKVGNFISVLTFRKFIIFDVIKTDGVYTIF